MCNGIIIFGLNGSGKSVLGKELSRILNYKHIDVEDYYFNESDIPYSSPRPREEFLSLIMNDIKKYRNFVMSAVKIDFTDDIQSFIKLGVFIDAPYEIRMNRVRERSLDKFGDRVMEGGDMYQSELEFYEFVKSRSIDNIEAWSQTLNCPILKVDGTVEITKNAILIHEKYKKLGGIK